MISNIVSNNANTTERPVNIVENFTYAFCHLVDFPPDGNGLSCVETENFTKCVQCKIPGGYVSGSPSTGLAVLYTLWILLLLISLLGITHNIVIVMVAGRKKSFSSFDFLIVFLAVVDAIVSITAAIVGTTELAYFGNWGEKSDLISWCYSTLYVFCTARSASSYVAVVICLNHLLMITFPMRAPGWFTIRSTAVYATVATVLAIFVGILRFLSYSFVPNLYRDIPVIEEFPFLPKATEVGKFLYLQMHAIHNTIDYWVPPPTILAIVLLAYWKAAQLTKQRKTLTKRDKTNLNAGRMFLPVAIFYLLTNIFPIIFMISNVVIKRADREWYFSLYVSSAVNSAVNLPIYYYRSGSFQQGTKRVLREVGLYKGNDVGVTSDWGTSGGTTSMT